ncbi:MAG: acetolactate synthase 2 catalytic subunit [Hyphomonadaceae bacterium]|nr:acetolactate synthase 2 catalytic subunit [Hyphomonadaceae bacterium]
MTATASLPKTDPDAKPKTGARLVVEALDRLGVEIVFGYPGGAIMPVYDALTSARFKHILVRHEQGAAFAADAYGRVTGKAGVCLATSGPGATNLITGIANAMMDSAPLVAITGNVASPLMGTDAFQEIDILGATLPMVKHSWIVRDAVDIPAVFEDAFRIAQSGRPGPVLIDLPKDVQNAVVDSPSFSRPSPAPFAHRIDPALLRRAEASISAAQRPVLYIGGGVRIGNAVDEVRAFAQTSGIPGVYTLQGLGVLPAEWTTCLGMIGMHGHRAANEAVQESDLLIVLGARFDDRATGQLATFASNARVIHIDIDAAELSKLRDADIAIAADLKAALTALHPRPPQIDAWRDRCADSKRAYAPRYDAPGCGIYAPALLKELSEQAGETFIAACDVGQHQMWTAQHCRFSSPHAHLTSGGLGAMGYGLPAGIGAKLARPDANVVVISGDGSFAMNIQELATLRRYNIALKILLLDNASLGLVRQWQELFFDRNFSEIDLSDNPDFVAVAQAFGVDAFRISRREDVSPGIARLLAAPGPCLAHVLIDAKENVWPLVPPGRSNAEMMHGDEI